MESSDLPLYLLPLYLSTSLPARKKPKKKAPQPEGLRRFSFFGVADGARTHDNRNHNPGLYQLSYSHRSHAL